MGILDRFRQQPDGIERRSSTAAQSAQQAALDAETVNASLSGITAAEEACAGLMQRSIALADVEGSSVNAGYFDINTMMMIARDLVLSGESTYTRELGYLKWIDNLDIRQSQYYVGGVPTPRNRVFHARYITNRTTGRGESAMANAKRLKLMSLQTETVIENESRAKSALVLPVPFTGADKTNFEKAIEKARGHVIGADPVGANRIDSAVPLYNTVRIGMDTPAHIVAAYETMYKHSLNAMGVMSLFTEGTDKREGIRLTLHTFIRPYARIIESAATQVDLDIKLSFAGLMAADIQAKARAFVAMASILDVDQALELSGLDEEVSR